jgi:hypothetical protein
MGCWFQALLNNSTFAWNLSSSPSVVVDSSVGCLYAAPLRVVIERAVNLHVFVQLNTSSPLAFATLLQGDNLLVSSAFQLLLQTAYGPSLRLTITANLSATNGVAEAGLLCVCACVCLFVCVCAFTLPVQTGGSGSPRTGWAT